MVRAVAAGAQILRSAGPGDVPSAGHRNLRYQGRTAYRGMPGGACRPGRATFIHSRFVHGRGINAAGLLPLHGSAVAIDGQAYGIVGESGAGKSTLAAAFLQAGFPLISDDVIALDFSEEFVRPLVIPSYPQQKLWQQSLDGFGISNESLRPIFKRETKFAVPLKAGYHSQPLPLAGLFELDKTERNEPSLVPVAKLDRLSLLRRHTYRNFWLDRLGMTDWHFRMTAGMAARIDVYRLERPTSGFTAPELVKRMLHILSKEGWSP